MFEIKDYSGWLFGHYRQKYWTQVLAYGREKYRFYNPIMQNHNQIRAIRENLFHNPNIPIFSIIVFYGNCELKDIAIETDNYYLIYPYEIKRTVKKIMSGSLAKYGDKHEIMNLFTQSVVNGEDRDIINSQQKTASYASRNKPQYSYYYSFNPLSLLRRWSR